MSGKSNSWIDHVKSVRAKNPSLSYKDALVKAKESYSKPTKGGSADSLRYIPPSKPVVLKVPKPRVKVSAKLGMGSGMEPGAEMVNGGVVYNLPQPVGGAAKKVRKPREKKVPVQMPGMVGTGFVEDLAKAVPTAFANQVGLAKKNITANRKALKGKNYGDAVVYGLTHPMNPLEGATQAAKDLSKPFQGLVMDAVTKSSSSKKKGGAGVSEDKYLAASQVNWAVPPVTGTAPVGRGSMIKM